MSVVRYERAGNTGLIVVDNPPVNAASQAVRAGLADAIAAVGADDVDVVAILGAGRTFIAGADIREFGKPPRGPTLPEVIAALEASPVPVLAVLHGHALGGGLEVALGAHVRVALPGTTLGFPEVTLGVIPGAGGTQRTPRLIGVAATLELVTTGRRIGADEALKLGLVDRIEHGEPRQVALGLAEALRRGEMQARVTSALPLAADPEAQKAAEARLAAARPARNAPRAAAEAVAAAQSLPFDEGMARERAIFAACLDTPERAALIHAFFAERRVAAIPEADATPRTVDRIGIVGAGTMGTGIATAALLADLPVTLVDRDPATLERAGAAIAHNLDGAVARGKLPADALPARLRKLDTATQLSALSEADLVIEAAFEDMDVKRAVFAELGALCRPGAILASNTSYLDVGALGAASGRPGDVLGLHFFSPAHVMRLVEVVVAPRTSAQVTATGFAVARRMRKLAVRAGVCDGFIGNRILMRTRTAADLMMLDGAAPDRIDAALEAAGWAMGPFRVADLAGLDIGWAARRRLAPSRDPAARYVEVGDRLCEAGFLGRKSGAGYYLYGEAGSGPNPEVARLVEEERQRKGITPRAFDEPEIVARYLTAMIAEAAAIVDEGIALRPSDVDVVQLAGYGFPRHLGGPLHQADAIGPAELVRRIERWAGEDPRFWQVPPILRRMAARGGSFAEMNEG